MKTLVTGGAGFIGAEVVRSLVQDKDERPTIFSRNPSLIRMDDVADRVEVIRGDVGTFSHVLDAVKAVNPDVIYHFGAMLSVPSDADPASAVQTNAMGTFHVLEAARLMGVRQVIFASSIGVYGSGIEDDVVDDFTLQRPVVFYGATKLFGEHMGLFYKRKYGLDFRGLRYPSVIGPGVRNPGFVQYTSWVIEESLKGNPFKLEVAPGLRVPVMYIKEAGKAAVQLAEAPVEGIKTVVYNVDGVHPTPSAQEIVEAVKSHTPAAQIAFNVDLQLQEMLSKAMKLMDDGRARAEWGWNPTYDLARMISEMDSELERHPTWYK